MQRETIPPRLLNRTTAPLMALLLTSTALVGFTSARAQELPTGGSVASGGVTIANPSSTQLTIKQSTIQRSSTGRAFRSAPAPGSISTSLHRHRRC
ncbi:hypothetical protein [Mesorhizobium sp. INR15]|uniref:hypothetical protein n=1 Tax=Mesorhizobium sp. INR15 TaxID=2654248 RepID=UPI0018966313|nr:hypothetical protein [Mesorhizobium sp. INR15]